MMRNKTLALTLLAACLLGAAGPLSAWTPDGERQADGSIVYRRAGAELILRGALSPEEEAALAADLGRLLDAWPRLTLRQAAARFSGPRQAEVLLIPSRLQVRDQELAAALPSGLTLFWTGGSFTYDLRLERNGLFPRLSGALFSPAELETRLFQAWSDPVAFIQRFDPEYVFRQLALQQEALAALRTELDQARAEQAQAQAALDASRRAQLALGNRDWFGGVRPLDPAAVRQVLERREADSQSPLRDFFAAYRQAGGSLNDWEVYLVLAVYRGEVSR